MSMCTKKLPPRRWDRSRKAMNVKLLKFREVLNSAYHLCGVAVLVVVPRYDLNECAFVAYRFALCLSSVKD